MSDFHDKVGEHAKDGVEAVEKGVKKFLGFKSRKRFFIAVGVLAVLFFAFAVVPKVFGIIPPPEHDLEAAVTELHWRSEGTIPDTWASAWHRTVIPQGESWRDAVLITRVGDGSARVGYVSGLPVCVWEAPSLAHKVGGGRTLAEVGNEGWLKGGFGGNIYAVAGRTCQGFDIDLCGGIC